MNIDIQAYNRFIYINSDNSYKNDLLVLSIIDDGCGIQNQEFNKILFSFSMNENKEYNFFKHGLSLKSAALRLANSFLIITKTENSASIGMLSKNLQYQANTDFILTPIVNFSIRDGLILPISNYNKQSLNLILSEVKFKFKDANEFYDYMNSFDTGKKLILFFSYILIFMIVFTKIDSYKL